MKLLHIGLYRTGEWGAMQEAFNEHYQYAEINTSTPNFNEEVKNMVDKFCPDIVFMQIQSEGIIDVDTVKYIKKKDVFVANWTGDVRTPVPDWYIDLAPHIDVTLFTNIADVKDLKGRGLRADYLQIGFDPNIYCPEAITEPILTTPPIVLCANNYDNHFPLSKYRKDIVAALKKEFKDKFAIYGNGWEKNNGSFNYSQVVEAAVYRGATIAINCSHFDYERYFSDRMLRVMGSGAFCLSHNYSGIGEDWKVGEDLVTFNNIEELITKCHYYLKPENNAERNSIAASGCHAAHNKFTFSHMVRNFKQLYEKWKHQA